MPKPARISTLLVLVFVLVLSWTVRGINHQKIPIPARGTWITSDKDTRYQLRRVERVFEEGRIAGRDPYLSYPDGSAIPWPPYYTAVAWAWAAPGAPSDRDARRDWVERRVASLPRWFGVATSGLAALGAAALAGPAAGLVAGTSHALSTASVVTSRVGNGDHHAFLAMLTAAMLVLASLALRPGGLDDARGSVRRGVGLGLLAGLALGSWVASLLYVGILQLVLGWLVIRHAWRSTIGLPGLGLSFHVAALVALMPAVLASPWRVEHPWTVVNLSWFHPLWLGLGALVFVPLPWIRNRVARRAYPAIVAVALGGLAVVSFASDAGPGRGIREGFAWMRREDAFMSVVAESRGFFGASAFDPVTVLGAGVFVLPLAWLACAWQAFRRDRTELLPWAVALPPLAVQAAQQVRFADVLAVPLAVVVAWAILAAWRAPALAGLRRRVALRGRIGIPAGFAGLLGVTLLAHAGMVGHTWTLRGRDPAAPGTPQSPADVVTRELAEWIRKHTPWPAEYSVLAPWTWGHDVEWIADRPTVATNFGTFVGEEAFRAPARFLMTEDPREGEAVLERHRARYVLVTSWLPHQVGPLIHASDLSKLDRYLDPGARDDLGLRPAWQRTLGARLLFAAQTPSAGGASGPSLDFVRLVHALRPDPRYAVPVPMGMVWERVRGAIVEAEGAPGDALEVTISVRVARAQYELTWTGVGVADTAGIARVRVPYATETRNGDVGSDGPAGWRFAGREGRVAIPEAAVLEGAVLPARL